MGKENGPTGVVSVMMKASGGFSTRWMTDLIFFFLRGRFIDINKLLYRIVEEKKTKENALR